MKRSINITVVLWALLVVLLLSDCRRRGENVPGVRGLWELRQVSVEDGDPPATYSSLQGERLVLTKGEYTLGSQSGSYSFNQALGRIVLTPGLASSSPEEFDVIQSGNQMLWRRNIADPAKSFQNRLSLVFARRR